MLSGRRSQGLLELVASPRIGTEGNVPPGELVNVEYGTVERLLEQNADLSAFAVVKEHDFKGCAAYAIAMAGDVDGGYLHDVIPFKRGGRCGPPG